MKIIVFGPTDGTGRQLIAQAHTAGHDVTAFARNTESIPARPRLTIVAGNTPDAGRVGDAMAGHAVVLFALGGRPWRRKERVCSTAMKNIIGG